MIINKKIFPLSGLKEQLFPTIVLENSKSFLQGHEAFVNCFLQTLESFSYITPIDLHSFEIELDFIIDITFDEFNLYRDEEYWLGICQAAIDCESLIRLTYDEPSTDNAA